MRLSLAAAACVALCPASAFAQAGTATPGQSLADQSLEQLMNIEVVSAGRKPQSLKTTAASVFVITSEDIRRSGMHSLPEVLRLAPGVQVARTASGQWAISIRGFNSEFANKLLVLVDDRVVYNDEWAGVFWDMQELPLDNVERIEVVRGPGAALWGANAVNGVINILTKSAESTQGGLGMAEAGTRDANTSARYGGQMGSTAFYRVTGRYGHEDSFPAVPGLDGVGYTAWNGWQSAAADFRIDWKPTARDAFFFSGSAYHSSFGDEVPVISVTNPTAPPRYVDEDSLSGSVAGHWEHLFLNGSSFEARVSWEHTEHGLALVPLGYSAFEAELIYHASLGSRNEMTWGVDYRGARYISTPSAQVNIQPAGAAVDSYASFLEDQFTLARDRLYFIAGVDIGHTQFNGVQVQPTGRLLWTPAKNLTTWAAVSRAVRTPALIDRGLEDISFVTSVTPSLLGVGEILGSPATKPEDALDYEAGQRVELGRRLSFDLSVFWNRYQHLLAAELGTPELVPAQGGDPAFLSLPYIGANSYHGDSYGLELSTTWNPSTRWRLTGGESWLKVHLGPYPGTPPGIITPNDAPVYQFDLRSNWDVTPRLQLDTALYYTGAIADAAIPRHLRGDLRLGWKASGNVELSTGVQDAFTPYHIELPSLLQNQQLQVGRNIYGAIVWRF